MRKRRMVVRRRCLQAFLAVMLTMVAWPARPAAAVLIPRHTEISLGREAAQEFERTAIIDNDPYLTAKIRRIGARLVSVCDDPSYPYEFHFVDSGVLNAFALPGGFIYLYRGLVQLLPNDDALAFVIGHEMTHVIRRHSMRQLEKNLLISTILNAVVPSNSGAQVLELVLSMHYSRKDETDADTRGLVMMAKAGFDPVQGAEAMRVIRRAAGSGRGVPKLLRSHPLPDDRIRRLTQQAAEIKAEYARQQPPADPDAPGPAERLAAAPEAAIPGLDDVALAPCRYFPLKTGARWTYRTRGPAGSGQRKVRVLEMVPGTPRGVYRVEVDLGRGVTAVQWMATTQDRVLRREGTGDRWVTEYGFPVADPPLAVAQASPAGPAAAEEEACLLCGGSGIAPSPRPTVPGFRLVGTEKVRVPAGEFDTVRIECLSPEGAVTATCWFAEGIGLVRSASATTGNVSELETLQMPVEAPVAPPPPADATTAPALKND